MTDKTLHLNLHKRWFDMVVSGDKKVEYRDLTDYWVNRLLREDCYEREHLLSLPFKVRSAFGLVSKPLPMKHDFKTITFRNGYWANADEAVFELQGIEIASPIKEWFPYETIESMGLDFEYWAKNNHFFAIKIGALLHSGKMNSVKKGIID